MRDRSRVLSETKEAFTTRLDKVWCTGKRCWRNTEQDNLVFGPHKSLVTITRLVESRSGHPVYTTRNPVSGSSSTELPLTSVTTSLFREHSGNRGHPPGPCLHPDGPLGWTSVLRGTPPRSFVPRSVPPSLSVQTRTGNLFMVRQAQVSSLFITVSTPRRPSGPPAPGSSLYRIYPRGPY